MRVRRLFSPRPRTALLLNEGWRNPGDAITTLGVRLLLDKAGAVCTHDLPFQAFSTWGPLFDDDDVDLVVLAGAPWVWDQCHRSDKFKSLREMMERFRRARWLMVGGGSAFLAGHLSGGTVQAETDLSIFAQFDLCIARDFVAHRLLAAAGAKAILLPCPSVLLPHVEPLFKKVAKTKRNVFVQDLRKSFIASYLPAAMLDDYDDMVDRYRNDGYEEVAWAPDAEAPGRPALSPMPEVLLTLAATHRFFTSRIHAAIPAAAFGASGTLFAIDTRAFTAMHVGLPVCGPYAPLFEAAAADQDKFTLNVDETLKLYRQALRPFM